MYRLRLFGGLGIEGAGGNGAGPATQRRPLALLAVLAVAGERGLTRDQAAALLWGDTDDRHALRSLSNALYAIRSEIGPEAVTSTITELRINPAAVASDVAEFAHALARDDPDAAVAAYGGPLLQGFHVPGAHAFEEWLDAERQRYATAFAGALERMAGTAAACGDHTAAARYWRRLAAEDPYNSHVAIGLARALAQAGDPGNALQALQAHVHALRAELGAEPVAEVLARIEELRSGVVSQPADLRRRSADRKRTEGEPPLAPGPPAPAPPVLAPMPPDATRVRSAPPRLAGYVSLGVIALALAGWGGARLAQRWWGPPVRSLAVLPLRNLTGDAGVAPYVDGVTEELTARLGRVARLRVTSRTSAALYRESRLNAAGIAGELGVEGILEGAVVRRGDRVRVTVQVIDARTDRHLGAETVELSWDSLTEVPAALAGSVLRSLRLTPTAEEQGRVANPAARDPRITGLLAQGRWTEALALDSTDARAWAARSLAYSDSLWWWPVAASWRPAPYLQVETDAAERAVRLDSTESEAWHAVGAVAANRNQWADAERWLRRAIALAPSNAGAHADLAYMLLLAGRTREGLEESRLSVRLDPRSKYVRRSHLWNLVVAREWPEYEGEAREWLRLWPDQASRADLYGNSLMVARLCEGRYGEALAAQESSATLLDPSTDLTHDPMRAIVLARLGRTADAAAMVRRAERVTDTYMRRYWMVWMYAAVGENDRAVYAFRDAVALGEVGLIPTLASCISEPLRRDPRWPELRRLVNLAH